MLAASTTDAGALFIVRSYIPPANMLYIKLRVCLPYLSIYLYMMLFKLERYQIYTFIVKQCIYIYVLMLCQFVRVRSACETFWLMHARTHVRMSKYISSRSTTPIIFIYLRKRVKSANIVRASFMYMRCINIEMGNLLARAIMLLVCVSMYICVR